MPIRGPRPCPQAGCGALVAGGGRCPEHRGAVPCRHPGCPGFSVFRGICAAHLEALHRELDARRPGPAGRGYGAAWRRVRAHQLRREPRCRACGARATEVDHMIRRRDGGSDQPSNLESLCKPCHSRKTHGEVGAQQRASARRERQ